jgi:hypothetical protein
MGLNGQVLDRAAIPGIIRSPGYPLSQEHCRWIET